MSGGNQQPSLDSAEHVGASGGENIEAKRTANYGYDSTNSVWRRFKVNSDGSLASGTALVTGPNVGQKTSHASTPQQLNGSSIASTNGILVQALASNSNNVYIGGSGVTTSTGYELQPGQAVPFTVDNIQDLYVIGGTTSDGVCWNVL